jgi:hypothetical protein
MQHNRVQVSTVGHGLLTTENHGVDSSILSLATSFSLHSALFWRAVLRLLLPQAGESREDVGRLPVRSR